MSDRIWNWKCFFIQKTQSECRSIWFYSAQHACSWFDLFAKTEIQIKKAISFTTFPCCHSLLNHKSSVMTDFACFAGVSWGREEEACGVCWAMTDVGRTQKCIFFSKLCVLGLKWLLLTSDHAAVCTQEHRLFGVAHIWVSKWCVDSFLT